MDIKEHELVLVDALDESVSLFNQLFGEVVAVRISTSAESEIVKASADRRSRLQGLDSLPLNAEIDNGIVEPIPANVFSLSEIEFLKHLCGFLTTAKNSIDMMRILQNNLSYKEICAQFNPSKPSSSSRGHASSSSSSSSSSSTTSAAITTTTSSTTAGFSSIPLPNSEGYCVLADDPEINRLRMQELFDRVVTLERTILDNKRIIRRDARRVCVLQEFLVKEINRSDELDVIVRQREDELVQVSAEKENLLREKAAALARRLSIGPPQSAPVTRHAASTGTSTSVSASTNSSSNSSVASSTLDTSATENSFVGHYVRKKFGSAYFFGLVIAFVNPYYKVVYEDADEEEMTRHQVQSTLWSSSVPMSKKNQIAKHAQLPMKATLRQSPSSSPSSSTSPSPVPTPTPAPAPVPAPTPTPTPTASISISSVTGNSKSFSGGNEVISVSSSVSSSNNSKISHLSSSSISESPVSSFKDAVLTAGHRRHPQPSPMRTRRSGGESSSSDSDLAWLHTDSENDIVEDENDDDYFLESQSAGKKSKFRLTRSSASRFEGRKKRKL